MRSTRLEVNINTFFQNTNLIKEYTNKEIMPVIKANAYGTYLNRKLKVINKFNIVAVALVSEGIEIRELGYKGEIFILNQPSITEIEEIENNQLTVGLSSQKFLEACIEKNAKFKIHLEIETGMNRTGINLNDLEKYLNLLEKSNLIIEGIYSHFSSADEDEKYTNKQISLFQEALEICSKKKIQFKYIHISASNGLLKYKLPFTNLVRPGILLYGYESYKDCKKIIPIKPICKLKSEINFIKTVPIHTKIGYSQNYTCDKETTVATIPIGYGDGFRRNLSNNGFVLINGKKAPIIGNICMDSIMVDITDIEAKIGEEVILFDEENIPLEELAKRCNTINYELLCTIGERVPRVFIEY